MRKHECPREADLLDALQASRWPESSEPSLRNHVSGCASCTDLLAIVAPLLDEHRLLLQEAAVPSSAIVWWRAQMRSRQEALARAGQPITFVQGITFACAAGLLATALGIYVPVFRRSLTWLLDRAGAWSGASLPAIEPLASSIVLAVAAALGLCAIVLPIALYFTFHED